MVLCCSMHASCFCCTVSAILAPDSSPRPKSFFCGRWKVFWSNEEKIALMLLLFFFFNFPRNNATDVPINLVACIANILKLAVRAALAKRSMRVCADDCRCCLSAPDCLQGVWHRSLYVSDLGCRPWRKKGLYSRWAPLVLNHLWQKGYFNSLWQNGLSEKLIVLSSELTLISSVCMALLITTCFAYLSV